MPESDLEHQTLHFLAQLETLEPTEAEGDGRELNRTEQKILRLDLGQKQ